MNFWEIVVVDRPKQAQKGRFVMTGTKKVADRVEDVAQQGKQEAHNAADKAKGMAQEGMERATQMAGQVADKARDFTQTAADKVGEFGTAVSHHANDAAGNVGTSLKNLADTVRDKAPTEGALGQMADSAAKGLERTGHYLETEGLSGLSKDVASLVRSHPIPALLIGLGLGYLVARASRE